MELKYSYHEHVTQYLPSVDYAQANLQIKPIKDLHVVQYIANYSIQLPPPSTEILRSSLVQQDLVQEVANKYHHKQSKQSSANNRSH
jgi:hypothetical protein